jgi:hypothetical protein
MGVVSSMMSVGAAIKHVVYSLATAYLDLDFSSNSYRLDDTASSFDAAFVGSSPKLTYGTTSNSTMTNSSGEIVWAPHNLLTYSEDFTDATWSTTFSAVAMDAVGPDGASNSAGTLTDNVSGGTGTAYAQVGLTVSTDTTYTFSLFAKADQLSEIQLRCANFTTPGNGGVHFDLAAGAVGNAAGSGVSAADAKIEDAGGGWYRCSITFTTDATDTSGLLRIYMTNGENASVPRDGTSSVLIYGAHVYRSDLGGMAPVPGAATGFETYVPTNGAVEYLPRVGHHAYNGTTWVNEGLLLESEARTNLIFDSNDPTTVNWDVQTTNASQNLTGPDGVANSGWTLEDDNANKYEQRRSSIAISATTAVFTASVFVLKDADETRFPEFQLLAAGGTENKHYVQLNSATGATVVRGNVGGSSVNVEDCGDWWRLSLALENTGGNTTLSFKILPAGGLTFNTNSTSAVGSIGFYGVQLELGSTPSSYMPSNATTQGFRDAQTLTVPSSELGYYDVYGANLIDNPTFNETAANSDWTPEAGWTIDTTKGVAEINATSTTRLNQLGVVATGGSALLEVKWDQTITTGTRLRLIGRNGANGSSVALMSGFTTGSGSFNAANGYATGSGSFTAYLDVDDGYTFQLMGVSGDVAEVDNISVREVNPLALSLAVEGRITASDAAGGQPIISQWKSANTIRIDTNVRWNAAYQGNVQILAYNSSSPYSVFEGVGSHSVSEGVLSPYSIAWRHTSSTLQAASSGSAISTTGTPNSGVVDLSASDMTIGLDFMGTISHFRQWNADIGETGIEEVTS